MSVQVVADVLGVVGVVVLLACYGALQLKRLRVDDLAYSLGNAVGAALILFSLTQSFNLPAFLIESAWLLISLYGLVQWGRRRSSGKAQPTPSGDS
ncbi:MAG: cyclic nucleotide-binding protein [Acidobacteriota bacterium]